MTAYDLLERRAGPIYQGAARLALTTDAPIIPILMIGTRGAPARPTVALAKELTQRVEHAIAGQAA